MSSERRRSSLSGFLGSLASRPLNQIRTEVDTTPLESDLLTSYQLSLPNPHELGEEAFYAAKVCNNKDMSVRIHNALSNIGILRSLIGKDVQDQLSVDTSRITRHFANQLPFCSGFMLKRIVSLLFVFEEQAVRWRLLGQEEVELRHLLIQPPAGMEVELRLRLEAILRKKRMLPTQQSNNSTRFDSELPAYSTT